MMMFTKMVVVDLDHLRVVPTVERVTAVGTRIQHIPDPIDFDDIRRVVSTAHHLG